MIKKINSNNSEETAFNNHNDECEECKKKDVSVFQNLILTGFKVCNSCQLSKTIFPL